MRLALWTPGLDPLLSAAVTEAPWSSVGVATDSDPHRCDATVVVAGAALDAGLLAELDSLPADHAVVVAGPGWATAADREVADRLGLLAGALSPVHEVRLRVGRELDPRAGAPLLVRDRVVAVDKVADDVAVLATAALGLTEHPVVTRRGRWAYLGLGCEAASWDRRDLLRLLVLAARRAGGRPPAPDVRVGLLGYGAIGAEHLRAVHAVAGLSLAAVVDRNAARTAAAVRDAVAAAAVPVAGDLDHLPAGGVELATSDVAPLRTGTDADALLADADVDLVVVSTPPASHHRWARAALEAGKHVVVEKPMALTAAECTDLMARAQAADRMLVVYQNRRFDADYAALAALVRAGRLGQPFHAETFVGGYGHPCNFWHSDQEVSGGAMFDWGSHLVDQLLDLMPGPLTSVTATDQRLVWHDVTNADHVRLTLHYADGAEATFVYSDLAAALKPKYYVLGTAGAVVGHWRTERVVARGPVGTLVEDALAPADSPAHLVLHDGDGSRTDVAVAPADGLRFHREVADLLTTGLPMTVTAAQSARVVAVLAAGEVSAQSGGRPVEVE